MQTYNAKVRLGQPGAAQWHNNIGKTKIIIYSSVDVKKYYDNKKEKATNGSFAIDISMNCNLDALM
jgi:hypothetical protein